MTMPEGPPEGVERRRDHLDLAQVMEDVSTLEKSVVGLAGSVTKIIPNQIQIGVAEMRKLFLQLLGVIAISTAIAIVVVIWQMRASVSQVNNHVERGHDILACVMQIPEATRSDMSVLTCRQAARQQ